MNDRHYRQIIATVALGIVVAGTSACAIGTTYHRPDVPSPPAFRESLPEGWTDAQPSDGAPRGEWWTLYKDSGLDELESQVE